MKKIFLALIMITVEMMPAIAQQVSQPHPISTQQQSAGADKLESAVTVTVSANPSAQKLADIKKIFIAPLGSSEGAELIRQELINRLIKSGSISVTESPEQADAILAGAAITTTGFYCNRYGGRSTYSARLVVRLVSKTKQVLWMDETTPKIFGPRSVSANVANKMVSDLCKAISKDKEATQISCSKVAGAK